MILPWSSSLAEKWDAYCDQHDQAWFWHRSGWMKYCEQRTNAMIMSFAVIENGNIVGICPIILEDHALVYQGGPCPKPLYRDADVLKELLLHLRSLYSAYAIKSYEYRGCIPEHSGSDISWNTRILNLNPYSEIEVINRWLHVRKSYKSLINNGYKKHQIEKSTDPRSVEILHELHRAQSGRDTRSQKTWDHMAAWVRSGHAYLCLAWNIVGICEGAIYVYSYKGHEYYGHAATNILNINHVLLWEAIRTSTANTFETGWQGHAANKKEESIEFFRRGFGGVNQPMIVTRA